jgi:hypothetical protein
MLLLEDEGITLVLLLFEQFKCVLKSLSEHVDHNFPKTCKIVTAIDQMVVMKAINNTAQLPIVVPYGRYL